jgi:hypothetical protein
MALVMLGDLRTATALRFASALAGGVLLPFLLFSLGYRGRGVVPISFLMFASLLFGELTERYLFFRAAPASRMPGGIR